MQLSDSILSELKSLSDKYPKLECDGMTTVLSNHLLSNNVPHKIMCGIVNWVDSDNFKNSIGHLWIETDDLVIDFRIAMWFGDKAPNGVISKDKLKELNLSYESVKQVYKNPGAVALEAHILTLTYHL
jgi:hypothetical protein